ncbi:hypothetical protein [Nocardia sp. CA-119907]|uniref:hypothetical protein n=1 Tax=Nocardia sp. CA-119907 TaxID=3239973 RepID=UPI003D98C103
MAPPRPTTVAVGERAGTGSAAHPATEVCVVDLVIEAPETLRPQPLVSNLPARFTLRE